MSIHCEQSDPTPPQPARAPSVRNERPWAGQPVRQRVGRLAGLGALLALIGCPGGDLPGFGDDPDLASTYGAETDAEFVVRYMQDWYLWNTQLPASPREDYATGQEALDALKVSQDSFSNIADAADYNRFFDEGQTVGFGFSFRVTDDKQAVQLLLVQPDAPARSAGLLRGDLITAIDATPVATLVAEDRVGEAFGPIEEGVERTFTLSRNGTSPDIVVRKALYDIRYVVADAVFDRGARRVGYVNYYSFAEKGLAPWRAALDRVLAQGAQDLIVDLRANGGGLLATTVEIGAALGGGPLERNPMTTLTFNDRHREEDRAFNFGRDPRAGRFQNLVWLTGKSTCSASEALIVGLDPYRRGIRVGETTCGKPVGFTPPQFRDKVYSIVSFRLRNAQGQTDYFNGLTPDCPVSDTGTGQFGQPDEPLTAAALTRLETGTCPAGTTAAGRAKALTHTGPLELTGGGDGFSRMINLW